MINKKILLLLFPILTIFIFTTILSGTEPHKDKLINRSTAIPIFQATFESGTLAPDIGGNALIDERNGGTITLVNNPDPRGSNLSSKVMQASIPSGTSIRAEYHNGHRFEINEKSYFYTWKEYFPENYLADTDVSWLVYSQWKTWPCGNYDNPKVPPYDTADYGTHICGSGGIFNDIGQHHRETYTYDIRFRANPDCNNLKLVNTQNQWHTFIKEIYWTNTNKGYYRFYRDGELLISVDNVKTLFDEFPADLGICDMYWGLGLYSKWTSLGREKISVYIDDMKIYDKDDGVSISDICQECAPQSGTSPSILNLLLLNTD